VRNILVPIDFSDTADAVLAIAASLAEAFGAKLWIVHVAAPNPDFVGFEAGPQSVRDQRAEHLHDDHRRLQQKADDLRARDLDATALLLEGPTVEKILEEADRLDVDGIVIGSHGHGAAYRLLLGSVSESVLRDARVPVTIIPRSSDGSDTA